MCVAKRQTLVCPVVSCTSPCTALSPLTRGQDRDSIRAGTDTFRVVFNEECGRSGAVYNIQWLVSC